MSMALIKSCGNCFVVHRVMAFVINSPSGAQDTCLLQWLGGQFVLSDVKLIMHPLKCVIVTGKLGGRKTVKLLFHFLQLFFFYFLF